MLMFLASVIEQLDLALEHIRKGDVHNARFGLMLTDNALELVLHRHAKDKVLRLKFASWRQEAYEHQRELDEALGRNFGDKVNFARVSGLMPERVAQTVSIMHGFRNQVYHAGLQHEMILAELSRFYFDVVCTALRTYEPGFFSWSSRDVMPERAKRYFTGSSVFPAKPEDFSKACETLAKSSGHIPAQFVATLADRFDQEVEDQDLCIGIVADGVYEGQQTTRDEAVIGCQIWPLAFSEKGKEFARQKGFSGSFHELTKWLEANYPLAYKRDPIRLWRSQASKLRTETNPHAALRRYDSFMNDTAQVREWISEAAAAADAEIQNAVDRARGK